MVLSHSSTDRQGATITNSSDTSSPVFQVAHFLPHIHHCEATRRNGVGLVHFVGRFNHNIPQDCLDTGIEDGPFYSLVYDHHGDIGLTLCLDGVDREAHYALFVGVQQIVDFLNHNCDVHHSEHPFDRSFEKAGVLLPRSIIKVFGFYDPSPGSPHFIDARDHILTPSELPILNADLVAKHDRICLAPGAKNETVRLLVDFKNIHDNHLSKGSILISRS